MDTIKKLKNNKMYSHVGALDGMCHLGRLTVSFRKKYFMIKW